MVWKECGEILGHHQFVILIILSLVVVDSFSFKDYSLEFQEDGLLTNQTWASYQGIFNTSVSPRSLSSEFTLCGSGRKE